MFYQMDWLLSGANIHTLWTSIVLIVFGYFVGTFIFSRIWISLFRKGDITFVNKKGKKEKMSRFGTSFVSTSMGKKFATIQFIVDLVKPMIAYWAIAFPMMKYVPFFNNALAGAIFLGTIIGHIWPIWWKFNGGLGIATGVGSLFMINYFVAFIGLFTYIGYVSYSRSSRNAGIIAAWAGISLLFIPYISNYVPFCVGPVINSGIGSMGQFIYPFMITLSLISYKFRNIIIKAMKNMKTKMIKKEIK